jgi:hypothetical protein
MARVTTSLVRWSFALLWVTLPFAAGPALAAALDPRSTGVRTVVAVALWLTWAVALGAALVPRTVSLTIVRIIAPAAPLLCVWAAAITPSPGVADIVAVSVTGLATVAALAPVTGDAFVNGSSYGDERRMPLRPPGPLLLGPIEATWAAVVVGAAAGPLLLAARLWVVGGMALLVGWPLAWFGARSLHRLAQRWLVFVPAGVGVGDRLGITDALLMQRRIVDHLAPALADSTAYDLTASALGIALQIDLNEPQVLTPVVRRRGRSDDSPPESVEVDQVLVAPTRPGAVLAEARRRNLPVG